MATEIFTMIRILTFFFFSLLVSLQMTAQENQAPASSDAIFEKVEVEADFPGGIPAWRKFLEQNLNPSVPVDNGAPSGSYTVYVQFIVGKDGQVSAIKPLTRQGYGMEAEVVRTMKKSGSWTPALQNGKPVNAYRKQPVTFMVEEEGFSITTQTPYTLFTDRDNELLIQMDDVKPENMDVSISQGTISTGSDGKFIARVSKPGRVLITVANRKKKNQRPGVMSIEVVKPVSNK